MKMNFNMDSKSILIGILLLIILAWMIFNRDITRALGYSQDVVEVLVEKEKELSQAIKDSLSLVPILEAKIDSLDEVLEASELQLSIIQINYEELVMDIEDNTVEEDIEFFAKYIDTDTLPRLLSVDNRIYVALFPDHLKKTNFIFISHDAYAEERPVLLGNIVTLKVTKKEQKREIALLKNTILKQDERYQTNKDIIIEKNKQIKLQRKQKRRRTWGIISGVLVGFGIGSLMYR